MGPDANLPAIALPDVVAAGPQSARRAGIRQAAEDFEAMFLSQMLAPVFAGLGKDSMFGAIEKGRSRSLKSHLIPIVAVRSWKNSNRGCCSPRIRPCSPSLRSPWTPILPQPFPQ